MWVTPPALPRASSSRSRARCAGGWARCGRAAVKERLSRDCRQQPGDELALSREDFPAGGGGGEPFRAVDFRKRRLVPAAGRPFQLEFVRLQGRRVEVAFDRPGRDGLAAGLDDVAETEKVALLQSSAGLLLELTLRHRQRILALG